MWKLWLCLALVWAALLPPLFTDGACTKEFEAASQAIEQLASKGTDPESMAEALRSVGASARVLTPENCRVSKPLFLSQCGSGILIFGAKPVSDRVCRLYRDSETRFQVFFNMKGQPVRVATNMKPFKSLPVPATSVVIHWAR